jgi:hypothetical protein
MDWSSSFPKPVRSFIFIVFCICFFFSLPSVAISQTQREVLGQDRQPAHILWEIYKEVEVLGHVENESFAKGEFHVNLDGNEDNKEEYVLVLNHHAAGKEKMLLQITYFESRRKNSPVKYAKCVREIECCVFGGRVEIERCDYSDSEINSLLPDILEGIRDEKKILELIKQ